MANSIVFSLDIIWLHNSKVISNSDNVIIETDLEHLKATCTIMNVSKEQVGFYSCKAVNEVSTEKTTAKLDLASTLATSATKTVTATATAMETTMETSTAIATEMSKATAMATSKTTATETSTAIATAMATATQNIEATETTEMMASKRSTASTAITATTESLVRATSEFTESSTINETSKTKSEKKMKTHKKVARTQKAKEESTTEVIVSQAQNVTEEETEDDEEHMEMTSMNQAHIEVIRGETQHERISDGSAVKITTKNQTFEDENMEIVEENEEIHVKIYKEVFSPEELEDFKVADEVNSILESIEAHQFGSGERPLREIATVAHLLKKGVEITEIIQLYDADFFPALKLPESQSALVQLVERQGYENLIAEILHNTTTDDENLLASTVGFRAFMRMVEVTKRSIEEIITNFKFEDFVSQEWKHKEIKDNEIVEVSESHASSIRTEKISVTGNEYD